MPRQSILEYLENFERFANDTAYVHWRGYRSYRWSYARVRRVAERFALLLEQRGIQRGDKVVLWGSNGAEWVAAFFGCILRGAIVVPMDRISSCDFVARVAAQVDAKLLVASPGLDVAGLARIEFESLDQLDSPPAQRYQPQPASRSDVVEIIFTSGTTAEPKGVVITHGNILANLEPIEREIEKYRKYERWFHPIRFLNLLPLSHVFGQFLGLFIPQLIGGTVIFQESLNPGEVLKTIKRERVSALVAVPRMLESLKDKLERDLAAEGKSEWLTQSLAASENEKIARRMWRFRRMHRRFGWKFWAFISGGAALDKSVEEFWRRLGFAVVQGYGLTETTSLISLNHPFKLARGGSIGKVLPGREMKLAPDGEILVRGENIASAYWQGKEMRPVLGEEGWFHTGDIGAQDEQGNLFFTGRKKNVIVTPEGMNVYPEDLERVLRAQPELKDVAVIGIERERNAEPCPVLLLRDHTADAGELVSRANKQLAEYQQMRRWVVWPEEDFPRTPTQKPKLAAIKQFAQAQLGGTATEGVPAGGLAELISSITRRPVTLKPGANLEDDLNLSSIDRVELQSALEDRFQVELSDRSFSEVRTVADLERLLQQPAPEEKVASRYRFPRWAQRWPVTWIRPFVYYLLTYPATLLMAWPKVIGREHLRGHNGPLLIVANHITFIDIGFVLFALPAGHRERLATAMIGERLMAMRHPPAEWNSLWARINQIAYGLVVALFNVFPLPQRTGFRESFAYAGEATERGYHVLVFPEGRRTTDGKLQKFQKGVGILAKNLRVPVVPIKIEGLWELKRKKSRFNRPGAVTVKVSEPMRFDDNLEPEQIAERLESIFKGL